MSSSFYNWDTDRNKNRSFLILYSTKEKDFVFMSVLLLDSSAHFLSGKTFSARQEAAECCIVLAIDKSLDLG